MTREAHDTNSRAQGGCQLGDDVASQTRSGARLRRLTEACASTSRDAAAIASPSFAVPDNRTLGGRRLKDAGCEAGRRSREDEVEFAAPPQGAKTQADNSQTARDSDGPAGECCGKGDTATKNHPRLDTAPNFHTIPVANSTRGPRFTDTNQSVLRQTPNFAPRLSEFPGDPGNSSAGDRPSGNATRLAGVYSEVQGCASRAPVVFAPGPPDEAQAKYPQPIGFAAGTKNPQNTFVFPGDRERSPSKSDSESVPGGARRGAGNTPAGSSEERNSRESEFCDPGPEDENQDHPASRPSAAWAAGKSAPEGQTEEAKSPLKNFGACAANPGKEGAGGGTTLSGGASAGTADPKAGDNANREVNPAAHPGCGLRNMTADLGCVPFPDGHGTRKAVCPARGPEGPRRLGRTRDAARGGSEREIRFSSPSSDDPGELFSASACASASSDSLSSGSSDPARPEKARFLRELGRGASGVVYETLDCDLEGRKAVKVIPFTVGVPCPLEAAILRSIEHPHIAAAEMISVHGRKLCIITAVADSDLASRVRLEKQGRPVSGDLLREWVWELVSAVLCLHKEGLIHADIKPANVLVYGDTLKLSDMTLATRIRTSNGTIIRHRLRLGTPRYRAPEVRKKHTDGWSSPADMWSLGCTLYEMAYGRPFFRTPKSAAKDRNKIERALDELIARWQERREQGKTASYFRGGKGIPRGFTDLIVRMLDCDQHSRITAQECFSHPFLRGMAPPPYFVGVVSCPNADTHSWSGRLLSYLGDLDVDEKLKLAACNSLVDKMNHKRPDRDDGDELERITETEVLVCEYLDWHLL